MSQLPSDWKLMRLDEVSEVINGGTPKTDVKEYWDGVHLWITPAEMGKRETPYIGESQRTLSEQGLQNSSATLVPPNSVIMSTRAPIGHLVINTKPMAFNQGCRGIIPRDGLEHKYLFYFLLSSIELLNELGTGTTFKELSSGKLKSVLIPVPPAFEQQRIVAILDEAFAGIATATANAEKNLQNTRELFDSTLQAVFSEKGVEWKEKRLEELGRITSSKRIFQSEYTSTGVPFYRTKEIKELANGSAISTELFISRERYAEIKDKFGVPQIGDILLTAIGTIGEIYVVDSDGEFYFKDGNVLWLKDFNSIDPYFLKYILRSFVEHLNRLSHGSAYNALPIEKLKKHSVYVPPAGEQKKIVLSLNELSENVTKLEAIYHQKLSELAELKQSLLQKAFAGELH